MGQVACSCSLATRAKMLMSHWRSSTATLSGPARGLYPDGGLSRAPNPSLCSEPWWFYLAVPQGQRNGSPGSGKRCWRLSSSSLSAASGVSISELNTAEAFGWAWKATRVWQGIPPARTSQTAPGPHSACSWPPLSLVWCSCSAVPRARACLPCCGSVTPTCDFAAEIVLCHTLAAPCFIFCLYICFLGEGSTWHLLLSSFVLLISASLSHFSVSFCFLTRVFHTDCNCSQCGVLWSFSRCASLLVKTNWLFYEYFFVSIS